MIARFDHRPRLTALLALSTTVLLVVVITLSTLLITSAPPAATSSSFSDVGNPGKPVPHLAGGTAAAPANVGGVGDSHAKAVAAFHNNR
jgi:hypothetical protein